MPLAESGHLQSVRKLRTPEEGGNVPLQRYTPQIVGDYIELREAARDTFKACTLAEQTSQNAGLIRAQCEILLAAHRCSAAIEASNTILAELCAHVKSWLPSPK